MRGIRFALGMWRFLGDRRAAALATWVQTIAVTVTLLYVNAQLRESMEQNDSPKRAKLHDLRQEYEDGVHKDIEQVRRLAWRSRMGLSPAQFHSEMVQVDSLDIIKRWKAEIHKFDSCEEDGVCDEKRTDAFICDEVESTYIALWHDAEDTRQTEWKPIVTSAGQGYMTYMLSRHCGFWRRIYQNVSVF